MQRATSRTTDRTGARRRKPTEARGTGQTSRRAPQDARRSRQNHTRQRRSLPSTQGPTARERNTSLDGLRALAVASVFLYHLDVTWLPSGHLGVIVFFVLSGYLVTSSLIRHQRDGVGAVPRFWLRRVARLWPPTALMIALTVLACIAFDHVLLTKARPDVLPGLGFFENVSYILRKVSYFEQIGGPSPLTHLWYLGVDAQFCLVWPLVMSLFGILPSRTVARRATLALALASAVAMGMLFDPNAGITRVYYGTDTRAFAPLVGAWLAYALPLGKRPARDLRPLVERMRLPIELAAALSLLVLGAAMALVPDTSALLYRGGMLAAALMAAAMVAALVLPGGLLSHALSLPPLAWLGSRSLGVYLWHYPLIQLMGAAAGAAPWWKPVLVGILSLLLAELSHQLVERPVAAGLSRAALPHDPLRARQERQAPRAAVAAGLLGLVLVVADAIGLAVIPDETLVPEDAIVSTGDAADHAMDLSKSNPSAADQSIPAADAVLHASAQEREAGRYDPVLIGDSVPGDAEAYWRGACPDGLLDCYVGRRPDQALQVLDEYLEQGVVGNIVIIQAFSNTLVTTEQLDHMIDACGEDRIVYLVTTRIPDSFEGAANAQIAAAAERHANVRLIDWHARSEGQDGWLYPDGEHLTPEGQPAYISMIVEAIDEDFANAGGTVTRRDGSGEQGTGTTVVVDNTAQATTAQDDATT